MKPIIGIIEWPYYDKDNDKIYEIPDEIVAKIAASGGIPVGIFPTQICDFQGTKLADIPPLDEGHKSDLITSVNMCDAIIKPGTLKAYEFDKFIQNYTVIRDIPYLGICGGMQIMTYPVGKLQNTNPNIKVENEEMHKSKDEYAHDIDIIQNSLLYDIMKTDRISVNSKHRFAISTTGSCQASAYAPDGVIEAIERKNNTFQLGVQWHPELLNDENSDKLFGRFVEEAKIYSLRRK